MKCLKGLQIVWVCVLVSSLVSGCGVGARYGAATVNMPPREGSLCSSCEYNQEVDATFGYFELRVVDWTGILLSAVTTAGTAQVERERAMERARARGDKAGTIVEYEVTPTAIVPGLKSEFLLRFAGDDIPYEFGGEGFDFGERSYFGFDMSVDFTPHFLEILPLVWQWTLSARIEMYDVDVPSRNVGYGLDEFHGDVYLGGALTYMVMYNMAARLDADFGIVSPFMVLLGYGTLSNTVGLEFNYMPLSWVTLQAYAKYARQSLIDRGSNVFRGGLGVTLSTPPDWF